MKRLIHIALAICLCLPLLSALFCVPAFATLPRRDIDYSEDFTDPAYEEGVLIDDHTLPLYGFWSVNQFSNYNAAPCSLFEKDGDRTVLHMQSYVGILSASEMFDAYVFSVRMKMPKGSVGGIAVSARHAAGTPKGPLYEADRYKENHPEDPDIQNRDRRGMLHDYSGLAVYPTSIKNSQGLTQFTVGVKVFVDDGKIGVSNRYYDVWLPVDSTDWFDVSFDDRGDSVTVCIDGEPICVVEMSDAGVFNDPDDQNEYFRHAVVKNPDGETVLELDNTKLATKARVALAMRASSCLIGAVSVVSENTDPPVTAPDYETVPPGGPDRESDTAPRAEIPTDPDTDADTEVKTQTPPDDDPQTDPPGELTREDGEPSDRPADTQTPVTDEKDGTADRVLSVVFGCVGVLLLAGIAVLLFKPKK